MQEPKVITDGILATGLVTAPAWAGWLGDLNQALTTATLVVGLVLGIGRVIAFCRRRKE